MQQAVITISGDELNLELIEKIKALFNGNGEVEIQIMVRPKRRPALREEGREEYFNRLKQSIREVKNAKNTVVFSDVDELDSFAQSLTVDHAQNPV